MSEVDLSALFKAARGDGPTASAKGAMWKGVAATTKIAGAAGAAGASAASASAAATTAGAAGAAAAGTSAALGTAGTVATVAAAAGATKLVVMGSLLGGAITVGLAMTAIHVRSPEPAPTTTYAASQSQEWESDTLRERDVPALTPLTRAAPSADDTHTRVEAIKARPVLDPAKLTLPKDAKRRTDGAFGAAKARAVDVGTDDDMLTREADLVAEARQKMVHGDPGGALSTIRATHALKTRQLVPEELALEAQALRALGQSGEATQVDGKLKTNFPEHRLAQ